MLMSSLPIRARIRSKLIRKVPKPKAWDGERERRLCVCERMRVREGEGQNFWTIDFSKLSPGGNRYGDDSPRSVQPE